MLTMTRCDVGRKTKGGEMVSLIVSSDYIQFQHLLECMLTLGVCELLNHSHFQFIGSID